MHKPNPKPWLLVSSLSLLALGLACSSSGSTSSGSPTPTTTPTASAKVGLVITDAPTEDWSLIGVKVLGLSLVPSAGGDPVSVFTATPATAPTINLAQLDQLGELLGQMTVPVGTYAGAMLTVSANPGDVSLVASPDPSAGFPLAGGTTVDPSQIKILHTTGTTGSLVVNLPEIKFKDVNGKSTTLDVTSGQSTAIQLEFDLGHPAFISERDPLGVANPVWVVNFDGQTVHHKHPGKLTNLLLRHGYGTLTAISADGTSMSIEKGHAVPGSTPTLVDNNVSIVLKADATNGTILHDLDAKTTTVVKSFSSLGSLDGKYIRFAGRYQEDGTLTGVRLWVSSTFKSVYVSPEGYVRKVSPTANKIWVLNDEGVSVPITVNANTKFFFRTPETALATATPIATGTSFLANGEFVRGFHVAVTVTDPLASSLTADSIDIEAARFAGRIRNATTTSFDYVRAFSDATDSYTSANVTYIADTTANGFDASGNAIQGYKWWNFTFPTLASTNGFGSAARTSFAAATGGAVDFGGTIGKLYANGESGLLWGDASNASGWSAAWTVLTPTTLPKGTVASAFSNGSFGLQVNGGTNIVPVSVSSTAGSATLVYQVHVTATDVTQTALDLSNAADLASFTSGLTVSSKVRVYGIPQADGSIKAYALLFWN